MPNMMYQMRVNGFEETKIAGTLSFRCRVPAIDREEQLMRFEDNVHGWLLDHLGAVWLEIVGRDAVRYGEQFELKVRLKVTS